MIRGNFESSISYLLQNGYQQWRIWMSYISDLVQDPFNLFVNTLRSRQDGRHSADDIFKWIFLNESVWISINFSLEFVPKGQINHIPALVQIMACRRPGDKPLSEPMMASLLTHIYVTRPQWVNATGLSLPWDKPLTWPFFITDISC